MAKNIAVSDDIYESLAKLKRENESFSEVIRRLLEHKGSLLDIANTKTFTKEEWSSVANVFSKQNQLDNKRKQELLKM